MAFGGPRSSCVCPGVHSARRQDSRKDLTPCRMALHFVSVGAHAPYSDETPGPTATRGRRTPLVAYAPSLSCAPPNENSTNSYFIGYLMITDLPEKQTTGCEINLCFARSWFPFIIFTQATPSTQPSERSLGHPAAR